MGSTAFFLQSGNPPRILKQTHPSNSSIVPRESHRDPSVKILLTDSRHIRGIHTVEQEPLIHLPPRLLFSMYSFYLHENAVLQIYLKETLLVQQDLMQKYKIVLMWKKRIKRIC